jgi:hypothetical protein
MGKHLKASSTVMRALEAGVAQQKRHGRAREFRRVIRGCASVTGVQETQFVVVCFIDLHGDTLTR